MNNTDVRLAIKANGLTHWQLAEIIGVSETHFSRILRHELPEDFKKALLDVVEKIGSGEVPDIAYFENKKLEYLAKKSMMKRASAERKIQRILDEIEDRRVGGGWGY